MEENNKTEAAPKGRRRWRRWVLALLLLVILLPFILFLLLQWSPVQNRVVDYLSTRISNSIEGEVTIDNVDVSIEEGLLLNGFVLLGAESDTILSAESLDVSLAKSLWSYFDDEVSIDNIDLERPYVKIVTEQGETQNNIQKILASFTKPTTDQKERTPLRLDLRQINVQNAFIQLIDRNNGQIQTIDLKRGYIMINSFLEDNSLDIEEVVLDQPVIRIVKEGDVVKTIIEDKEVASIQDSVQQAKEPIKISVKSLAINKGVFSLNNFNKKPHGYTDVLDLSHFEISDIDLKVSDFELGAEMDVSFDLDKFDFVDDKGFVVRSFTSQDVVINSNKIDFPSLSFVTDRTNLSRSLSMTFESFDDFNNFERKIVMNARFDNSRVYLGDIMHFVKKLNTSPFFLQNKTRTVALSGRVSGPIDNLAGQNMNFGVGDEFALQASFSTRKISIKDREFLDIRMKRLETNIEFLKSFIPGFKPPSNFDKLGNIDFKGSFYGYLKDFVVFGGLNSAMGDAFLDMRLDIKDGTSLAKYSGELSLEQFQLGAWTDNDDFGLVDFTAAITDGQGLTLNSVYSDLYATVESLTFKDYEYRDFVMDAQVDKNAFNGEFSIEDENIDFIFDGNIEIKDKVPHLDFKANIEKIDLQKLNLSKDPFSFKGNVDINGYGQTINDIVGNMVASDLIVNANDTIYMMDTVSLTAYESSTVGREITLFSDIASIELQGDYDLNTIVEDGKRLLKKNYPHYTQNWKINNSQPMGQQDLRFDISIYDSQNFFDLLGVSDMRTKGFKAKGTLDTDKGDLSFASSTPFFGLKDNKFWDIQLLISSDDQSGDVLINIDSTVIGSNSFNPIDLQSKMKGDTVNFLVSTSELVDSLESVDIQGQLLPHPRGYEISITDNKIVALGSEWSFDKKNKIVVGSNYHKIDNLRMTDGTRAITIDDVDRKGIALYLADFNFLTINGLIDYDKMQFAGQGDVSVFVDDVYESKNVEANVYVDDFTINGDSYGTLEVDVSKDDRAPVNLLVSLGNQTQELLVNATMDPDRDNYVDARVKTKDFPLSIFEYLLKDGIKNTFGTINLDANVNGPITDLKIDGEGLLNGGVTVVYTGVEYKFDNQKVIVTDRVIDLTGSQITDPEGGVGTITGGMNHKLFKDFTLDATLSGTDVVALNTTKFDNPDYYGYGKGDMSATFTGPFHLVNMRIVAEAGEGSVLNIPIWEGETSTDKNFIKFIRREELFEEQDANEKKFRFEGLDIAINLTMTPAARVNIIFDESRGDVIQGNGRGNMKMNITRYGDFDMYGTYEIETGKYLFTALGAVAKPFEVRRGGQIRWTGDPVNATLDIVADYEVRTSLDLFLTEFVQENPRLQAASRSKTQVELILNLGGTLYKPQVNFDLDFPDVQGELRSVVESKMRTLDANQAELNSQVLGLIVFNSFLPSNSNQIALGGDEIGSAGIGTLSEFISSQASLLFTGLLNEVFADNGLISGFDFDIGLRKNSFNGVQNNNNGIAPDEIEVNLKNRFRFLDERLSLDLGGNYVWDNVLNGNAVGNYFIGNFVIEYFLTDDRKLKLRMYGRYDYDEIAAARRQKYGLGVGYRTEFGTLSDFKEKMAERFRITQDENVEQED